MNERLVLFRGTGAAQVAFSWALGSLPQAFLRHQLLSFKPRPARWPAASRLLHCFAAETRRTAPRLLPLEQPDGLGGQQRVCVLSCCLEPAVRGLHPQPSCPHLLHPNQSTVLLPLSLNRLPDLKPSLSIFLSCPPRFLTLGTCPASTHAVPAGPWRAKTTSLRRTETIKRHLTSLHDEWRAEAGRGLLAAAEGTSHSWATWGYIFLTSR